ncbi:hypothetical protein [Streptomyces violaceusniger]|uniref:hypothetical protein n=1 Tax=Streptomyces violaceusniger TaxID=68280 RepID=UPI0036A7C8DB
MYATNGTGDVHLVCFDRQHRVALICPGGPDAGHPWMLPAVRRGKSELYRRAARRLACAMAPAGAIRLGAVTGRIRAAAPGTTPQRGGRRIFTSHVASSGALRGVGVPLVWLPYAQVAELAAGLEVVDLGLFLEGYVDGWIPDGWITLQ